MTWKSVPDIITMFHQEEGGTVGASFGVGWGQLVTNPKPGLVLDEINRLASSVQQLPSTW